MLVCIINRQNACIPDDPYITVFNEERHNTGAKGRKRPHEMKKESHESKWEIDRFCYPIRLA